MASHFFMIVQVELIRCKDGKRIYSQNVKYESASHKLKEWITDEKQILKIEFDRACQNIGDMILDKFFGFEDEGQRLANNTSNRKNL